MAAYNRISPFQDPASSAPITVSGSVALTLGGTLYAPMAVASLGGNAAVPLTSGVARTAGYAGRAVLYDRTLTGNAALSVNEPSASTSAPYVSVPLHFAPAARTTATAAVDEALHAGALTNGAAAAAPLAAVAPPPSKQAAARATGVQAFPLVQLPRTAVNIVVFKPVLWVSKLELLRPQRAWRPRVG